MTTHDDNVANLVNISQATIRERDSYIEDCHDTILEQQKEIERLKRANVKANAEMNTYRMQAAALEQELRELKGEDNE